MMRIKGIYASTECRWGYVVMGNISEVPGERERHWSERRSFIEAKRSKRHQTSDTRQGTKELRKAVEAK